MLSSSCHPEPPQLCHPELTLRRISPSPSSHCEPKVEQSPLSPSLRGGRSPTKQSPLRSFKQCILIPHIKTKKLYQYVALTVSAQMFYLLKKELSKYQFKINNFGSSSVRWAIISLMASLFNICGVHLSSFLFLLQIMQLIRR